MKLWYTYYLSFKLPINLLGRLHRIITISCFCLCKTTITQPQQEPRYSSLKSIRTSSRTSAILLIVSSKRSLNAGTLKDQRSTLCHTYPSGITWERQRLYYHQFKSLSESVNQILCACQMVQPRECRHTVG